MVVIETVTISVRKEKLIVFITTVMASITGYLALSHPTEAAIVGTITAAALVFWSEGINTEATA